jgi:putative NADH-flavin reductase
MPHLAIFGGTGPSGQCVIEEALSRKYTMTIFARNPSKLPSHVASSLSVTVVEGSLSDRDAVGRTIHGADAVLSTLGPSLSVGTAVSGLKTRGTPIAEGYKVILDVMKEQGVKRLIALGTVSIHADGDGSSVLVRGMVTAVWIFLHFAWKDIVTLAKEIQASEGIEWTIARVGNLTSGQGGNVGAGYIGKDGTVVSLARKDLARFYLDEFENGKWIYQLPAIYSK